MVRLTAHRLLVLLCMTLSSMVWGAAGPAWSAAQKGQTADVLQEQARQLQRAGQYQEALSLALQALQRRYQEAGPEHADTAVSLTMTGLLYLELGAYGEALPLLQRALQVRFKVLGASHPETAASLNYLGELYRRQGSLDEALPLIQRALQIREKVLGAHHADLAATLTTLALYYQDRGEDAKALPLLERALAIRERALGYNHPELAASLLNLGEYHRRWGAFQKALPWLEKARQICESSLGRLHPATAQSLGSLGNLYADMGFYSRAQTALEQALQVRQKSLGLEHPLAIQSLSDLGILYIRQKEVDKARPLLERALAIRERRWPAGHPEVAASYQDMAILQQALGNWDSALSWGQKALQIRESALGPEHPATLASLETSAAIHRQMGSPARAVPFLSRVLPVREKVLGAEHPDLLAFLILLAQVTREAGQYDQSLALWQRTWTIRKKALGEGHPETVATLDNLAALALDLGIYTKALSWAEQACQLREKTLGPEHQATAVSLGRLAAVQQAMGEYDLALPLWERAVKIMETAQPGENLELARAYLDLAALRQAREEYAEALSLCQKALPIREKVLGTAHPDTALGLARLAALYEDWGLWAQARSSYEKSVALLSKAQGAPRREFGQTLLRLAGLLESMGEFEQALPLWSRAASIAEETLGAEHPQTGRILAALGFGHLAAGETEKAEKYFDRIKAREVRVDVALARGRFDDAWQLLEDVPPPLVSSPDFQIRWYTQKGRALAGVGMLPEAAVALWEAVQGADKQPWPQAPFWRVIPALAASDRPHEQLLMVLISLDTAGAPLPPELQELGRSPRQAALALASALNGRRFLRALARGPYEVGRSELSEELRQRQLFLNRRLAANARQWEKAVQGSKEALQEAIEVRKKLLSELDAIRADLNLTQPLAAALYYPSPQRLENHPLADDEVTLAYVLGEERGFIFVVRSTGVEYVHALTLGRAALAAEVRDFLTPLREGAPAAFSPEKGQELYELLLAKPLATVAPSDRLIIIPDGVLGVLPFEALVMAAGQDAATSVFVSDQRSLVYYPSPAVLAEQRGRPEEPKNRAFLAVGNPVFLPPKISPGDRGQQETQPAPPSTAAGPGHRALASHKDWGPISPGERQDHWLHYLPRPDREPGLQELARLFAAESEPPALLLGPSATAGQLRRMPLADYRFLHFDTCTDYSGAVQEVLQPFILLGREESAPLSHGPLTMRDILGLSLGAHLVVLENGIIGRGQALADGGVASLTRALQYAGARSVLVNLWPVADPAARQFYQQLYGALQAGQTRREAVFQARQQLRRSHPDPSIWAAWQFWGED